MHQLKTRQICLFFIAFVPVGKLLILPSIIAGISFNDMWISALISCLFDFLTIIFVLYFCKKNRTDFFTLIENSLGKLASKIILITFAIVLFLKALLPINDLKNYVEITLYETIPSSIYFIPFFILCFYFCSKPLRVLGRISDIMWIITLIGIVLLFALSISHVKLDNLLPLGVNGMGKILKGSTNSALWFGDGVYMLFFAGNFIYKKRDGLKICASYLSAGLLVILFMIFFYTIFTAIAPRQTYSLTEISKYSTVINNIGRFDYIGIALILFSNLFSTSMPIYFAVFCLQKAFNTQKKWHFSLALTLLLTMLIYLLREHFYTIEKLLLNYGNFIFLATFNLVPIILSIIPLKERRRETIKT